MWTFDVVWIMGTVVRYNDKLGYKMILLPSSFVVVFFFYFQSHALWYFTTSHAPYHYIRFSLCKWNLKNKNSFVLFSYLIQTHKLYLIKSISYCRTWYFIITCFISKTFFLFFWENLVLEKNFSFGNTKIVQPFQYQVTPSIIGIRS